MKGPSGGSATSVSSLGQPMAIVLMVLILGASLYLWSQGYLRSRAALITLLAVLAVLAYFGFFDKSTTAPY